VEDLPQLVQQNGEAASEYGAFAPKGTVSRKAQTPGKGDEDPVPASSGAQPAGFHNHVTAADLQRHGWAGGRHAAHSYS
jgi:hypothetical protein